MIWQSGSIFWGDSAQYLSPLHNYSMKDLGQFQKLFFTDEIRERQIVKKGVFEGLVSRRPAQHLWFSNIYSLNKSNNIIESMTCDSEGRTSLKKWLSEDPVVDSLVQHLRHFRTYSLIESFHPIDLAYWKNFREISRREVRFWNPSLKESSPSAFIPSALSSRLLLWFH